MSDKSKDVPDDDEEQYKFGRINKDQTDTCLDRALELYDNHHNMTQDELVLILCFFHTCCDTYVVTLMSKCLMASPSG